VIEANSTIPTKKSKVYSTAADNQPSVEIHILQGERKMAKDNRPVGRFILDGIPPAPRGIPQVEVTFDIDANGILHVTAKDKGTGKEQKIRIEAGSGLSPEEIEKMKNEAKANEASDKAEREKVDKINEADSLIFQTEKQLKEDGDKIPADKKAPIESGLEQLKAAHKSQDVAQIDTATAALNTAWTAASEDMYKAQQQQPGQDAGNNQNQGGGAQGNNGGGKSGGGNAENVTDVDFEEVK
jgi:molecular chaperone DnaK